jgi:glycosyltransferase involved in cell wall biosynthesis
MGLGIQRFVHLKLRNRRFTYRVIPGKNKAKTVSVLGMMRLRNEELILQDSLDHLAKFVDGIIIYDDCSGDKSVEIASQHPAVLEICVNKKWRKRQRAWEETANRGLLLKRAQRFNPGWLFYADADERFEGDIRSFLLNCPLGINGIRISLFDAYITPTDKRGYKSSMTLLGFRKFFGVEQRDILMIWRNLPGVDFKNPDAREPQGVEGNIVTKFYCQHYGKAVSIQQWEDTCKYYADNFPQYSEKWLARMGKAVHTKSDFGTELLPWREVKAKGKLI